VPGTFVTLGNGHQPFARLLQAVTDARVVLPEPVVVQHGHTSCNAPWATTVSFLAPEAYEGHVRDASVVVTHAGAGSVLHAVRAGKVPIVMTRLARFDEIVDDHQVEFASAMSDQGRVLLIQDARDLERAVSEAMRRQGDMAFRSAEPPLVEEVKRVLDQWAAGQGTD